MWIMAEQDQLKHNVVSKQMQNALQYCVMCQRRQLVHWIYSLANLKV